jgi:hypothetical protein
LYAQLLKNVKSGEYRPTRFIRGMRNNPWALEGLNDYTVRLIFTPNVLLNPSSGVKMYRYTTLTRKNRESYERELDEIVSTLAR